MADIHDYLVNDKYVNNSDKKNVNDAINPTYYQVGGVECIDAIRSASFSMEAYRGFLKGNVIKYLWRYERKHLRNPVEDLHKAEWYLKKLISSYESNMATESINE